MQKPIDDTVWNCYRVFLMFGGKLEYVGRKVIATYPDNKYFHANITTYHSGTKGSRFLIKYLVRGKNEA